MKKLKIMLLTISCVLLVISGGFLFNAGSFDKNVVSVGDSKKNDDPVIIFDDSVFVEESWIDNASDSYAGGTGTKQDPFQISNASELALLSKNCYETSGYSKNKHFIITSDITLNDGYFEEDGTYHDGGDGKLYLWQPIGCTKTSNHYFKNASFDGNNFVVSGVYTNLTTSFSGLFGITTDVTIKNVKVTNSYVKTTGSSSAGVVGSAGMKSEVSNCLFDGFVVATGTSSIYIGGVVGAVTSVNVLVSECTNYGDVYANGTQSVGGVVGWGYYANTIQNCTNFGNIEAPKAYDVGGICGHGKVFDSVNYGKIYSNSSAGGIVGCSLQVDNSNNYGQVTTYGASAGGIAGNLRKNVTNSNNYGNVSSETTDCVGGIGGACYGHIFNCTNYGKTSGRNYVGGIAGKVSWEDLIVSECINFGEVSGGSHTGGVVGHLHKGKILYCENHGDVAVRSIRFGGVVGFIENESKVYNSYSTSQVKGKFSNEIYFTDLKLFFINLKTGKIGLRKNNATATFMPDLTMQILEEKGFLIL